MIACRFSQELCYHYKFSWDKDSERFYMIYQVIQFNHTTGEKIYTKQLTCMILTGKQTHSQSLYYMPWKNIYRFSCNNQCILKYISMWKNSVLQNHQFDIYGILSWNQSLYQIWSTVWGGIATTASFENDGVKEKTFYTTVAGKQMHLWNAFWVTI